MLINTVPLWSILLVDVTTAIIGVGFVALIKAPKKSAEHVARRMAEAENSGQPALEPMSDANADRSLIAGVRRVFADLKDGFGSRGAGRTCATWCSVTPWCASWPWRR